MLISFPAVSYKSYELSLWRNCCDTRTYSLAFWKILRILTGQDAYLRTFTYGIACSEEGVWWKGFSVPRTRSCEGVATHPFLTNQIDLVWWLAYSSNQVWSVGKYQCLLDSYYRVCVLTTDCWLALASGMARQLIGNIPPSDFWVWGIVGGLLRNTLPAKVICSLVNVMEKWTRSNHGSENKAVNSSWLQMGCTSTY